MLVENPGSCQRIPQGKGDLPQLSALIETLVSMLV